MRRKGLACRGKWQQVTAPVSSEEMSNVIRDEMQAVVLEMPKMTGTRQTTAMQAQKISHG